MEIEEVLHAPAAKRVAARALVLSAVVCRGFIEQDFGDKKAEEFRNRISDWMKSVNIEGELESHERESLRTPLGGLNKQTAINLVWLAEGMAVLAWALGCRELPQHDSYDIPAEIGSSVGFMNNEAHKLVSNASLRSSDELEAYAERAFAIHWRLREFSLRPTPLDFAKFAKEAWFGPLNLSAVGLINNDLAIAGKPIYEADQNGISRCFSAARERHRAINWLLGHNELYSEVDTST